MDFDQLNIFLTVARHNSFSRAAEKCFRTQPAISAQIRALEEEVGARLFDRSGGKVALTAAGKVFRQYATEVMESQRRILTQVAEMERVPRGEMIVAANEGTCLHVLPEVFAEFKKQCPRVAVSIQRMESAKILEAVHDHTADFGVVSMPVQDPRLTALVIHNDQLALITAPGHPLSWLKQKAIPLEQIAQFPLVLPKAGRTRDAIEEMFLAHQLKLTIAMELDSSELLKRFVAADVGVGFISRSHVVGDAKARLLTSLAFEGPPIQRDLALIFRKDKALSKAALAFIDIAVKARSSPSAGR